MTPSTDIITDEWLTNNIASFGAILKINGNKRIWLKMESRDQKGHATVQLISVCTVGKILILFNVYGNIHGNAWKSGKGGPPLA